MDLPIPTKVLLDRYDIVMAAFCFPVFFFLCQIAYIILFVVLHFCLFSLLYTQWNFGAFGLIKISPYLNGLL